MTTVLLFARARELAGQRRLEVPDGTVADVVAALTERWGDEFGRLCGVCTVVVDGVVVPRDEHAVAPSGAELGILPPVSGGAGDADHGHERHADHGHAHHDGSGAPRTVRVGVLTVSDRASRGDYADESGPAVEAAVVGLLPSRVVERAVVPDDPAAVSATVARWCDEGAVDLVLTTGGTGLSPRDTTPEAVAAVLDVQAPGLGELMRSAGLRSTPLAALSRQVAGRRGATVVVTLPGSVRGAAESLAAVAEVLGHAVDMAGGR